MKIGIAYDLKPSVRPNDSLPDDFFEEAEVTLSNLVLGAIASNTKGH